MENLKKETTEMIAQLVIATIHYDHVPLEFNPDPKVKALSLGEQIDKHIREAVAQGKLVQEVALRFEGMEAQHQLVEAYRPRPNGGTSRAADRA